VPPFAGFIDCHSHLAPTGDDGARSVEEGVGLAQEARRAGTAVLFLTPHVWPELPMHDARERRFRAAVAAMAEAPDLPELRIGFELTPDAALLDDDPRRYALAGTGLCLVETPFSGRLHTFYALAEHVEAAGLLPLIAHPERSLSLTGAPAEVARLLERGWPVQVTGASLTGRNGPDSERLALRLLRSATQCIVASDGHRAYRPAVLDAAWERVVAELGVEAAERAFGGAGIPGLSAAAS